MEMHPTIEIDLIVGLNWEIEKDSKRCEDGWKADMNWKVCYIRNPFTISVFWLCLSSWAEI